MISSLCCLVVVICVFHDSSDVLVGAEEYAGERYHG